MNKKEHKAIQNLSGQKFGRLTAIKREYVLNKNGKLVPKWFCRCDCGKTSHGLVSQLKSGQKRSCGCLHWINEHNHRNKLPIGEKPKRDLIHAYKQSARQRGIKYKLSVKFFELITKKNCYYCDLAPEQIRVNNKFSEDIYIYNGIDRIDNDKGYTESNCVPCCRGCNYAKHKMSTEEFRNWIKKIYKNYIINHMTRKF